jgi:hypothetical protein
MIVDLFRGLQGESEGGATTSMVGGARRHVRGRGMVAAVAGTFMMVVTGLRDREGRPNPPREECRGKADRWRLR